MLRKLSFVARLKPGVSVSQANAGLQVLVPEIFKALPPRSNESGGQSVAHGSLDAYSMANGTSVTWLLSMDIMLLLMAMAAVALIIACANLGNLLLGRAAKRRSEIATRLAIRRDAVAPGAATADGECCVIGGRRCDRSYHRALGEPKHCCGRFRTRATPSCWIYRGTRSWLPLP